MASKRPSGANRSTRVAEQIHQELALLIQTELRDPLAGMVTLTGVELTPDYAHATVYLTVFPDDQATVAATLDGLRRSAGFLRSQIGRRVRIHTTPELRFAIDRSVAQGMQMDRLIDEANRRRAQE